MLDGMFLKHIFCKYIKLKHFLYFMAVVDFLLAAVDIDSLYLTIMAF